MAFISDIGPASSEQTLIKLLAQLFNSCFLVYGGKDPRADLDDEQRAKFLNHARTALADAFEEFIETVGKPKSQ